MGSNGQRRSKGLQKNVSVYLGARDGWQHDILREVCRQFNLTESEFFRELFLQRLARWKLYDDIRGEPIDEAIARFKRRRAVVALPESLDQAQQEDPYEWDASRSNRKGPKRPA